MCRSWTTLSPVPPTRPSLQSRPGSPAQARGRCGARSEPPVTKLAAAGFFNFWAPRLGPHFESLLRGKSHSFGSAVTKTGPEYGPLFGADFSAKVRFSVNPAGAFLCTASRSTPSRARIFKRLKHQRQQRRNAHNAILFGGVADISPPTWLRDQQLPARSASHTCCELGAWPFLYLSSSAQTATWEPTKTWRASALICIAAD